MLKLADLTFFQATNVFEFTTKSSVQPIYTAFMYRFCLKSVRREEKDFADTLVEIELLDIC